MASLTDNVNVRGRIIEYLIAGEDEKLRGELVHALMNREKGIPAFNTENALGDYQRSSALGRSESRGVMQFEGKTIHSLIGLPTFAIDPDAAADFLHKVNALSVAGRFLRLRQ